MANHALVIGAGAIPGLAPLPTVPSDVQAVAAKVADLRYSYVQVFADDAIITLSDAAAQPAAILSLLSSWSGAPSDMTLVSFAGYASLSAENEPVLLLSGETPETIGELPISDLYHALNTINSRSTLAWFDLCAVIPEHAERIAISLASAARRFGVLELATCARTIAERNSAKNVMGRFTSALLDGLDNEDLVTRYAGDLTFARLAQYVAGVWSNQEGTAPFLRATSGGEATILYTRWTPPHQDLLVHIYNHRSKPHCTFCGARYGFDNMYLCSVCGALYCIRCIHQREAVQPKGHRCDCGGLIL